MYKMCKSSFLFLFLFLVFVVTTVHAHEWAKTYGVDYGDWASSIQQTTDGGYIVAGMTESLGVDSDAWVLKLDINGNIQWQKTYGGDYGDWASSIQQTTDGGYIVAGMILSFSSMDMNVDTWVLKLDINGNIQWQKTYGGTGDVFSIQQTTDGGYIVAGQTFPGFWADDTTDAWVLKLDADGNIQWQKNYRGGYGDGARSIQQTTDGGYIVAGWTKYHSSNNPFLKVSNVGILKLDINGNIQWQRTYGGDYGDWASSIQQTTDGGYIVAGMTESFGVGNEDVWVLKLNANGNIPGCSAEKISDAIVKDTRTTRFNTSIYVSVADTSAIDTHTTAINTDASPTVVCFSQGNLSNSQAGYPAEPLDALSLDIPVSPADHTITVLAGQVSIKPSLKIPSTDQNKQAQLLMYIYLLNYNSAGVLFYGPTVSLNNIVGFDSFFPKPIDLSNYPGLLADIYYGYSLPDKEIKYNAYELKITE